MSGYKSYSWWQPPLNQTTKGYSDDEERLDAAVRLVVDRQLESHGYHRDTLGRPDFVVRYGVALYRQTTPTFREYLAYRTDGHGKDGGAAKDAPEGTFVLEALDVSSGRVGWRATAPAVFEHGPSINPVGPAATEMMESVPQSESN
jgi:hypothetical protein